jgi:long-subunit fatty acid transport protein
MILGLLMLGPHLIRAQMAMGQYEDEAPLQTWNTYGIQTAASLGRGGAGFTLAVDSSSSLFNPALLTQLSQLSICLSGAYNAASLYRYSIFNTGVFRSMQNQTLGIFTGDYIGFSGRIGDWALSLSVSNHESLSRPGLDWNYTFKNQLYYTLSFEQKGILVNTNLSGAKKISDSLSIGLGLNYVRGNFEKHIVEQWFFPDMTITDSKTLQVEGFYLNGGIVWSPSKTMSLAAVFRTPYKRKADGDSLYRFEFPAANTDIQITGGGESVFLQPMVIGLGMNFEFFKDVLFAADVSFFNWARYEVDFFDETLPRDFKNIIKANAGFELFSRYSLFNLNLVSPLRFGFIYDPQPMRTPDSFYYGLTLGTGFKFRNVIADFAYFLGKESGSGHNLAIKKILVTVSFQIGRVL